MSTSRITLKQISDACGLSLSTVSAALNNSDGRYNAETVRHVREVAERLGYRGNQQAKILRGAPSGLIGIIKNVSLHQVVAEFVTYAGEAIHEEGYRFFSSDVCNYLLVGSGGLPRSLEVMLDARVEGVLIENQSYSREMEIAVKTAIKGNIPVVLADGYPYDNIPYVGTDYYKGFCDLCTHFVKRGYRHIALALSEQDMASVEKHFTKKGATNWRVNEAVRAVRAMSAKYDIKMDLMPMWDDEDSPSLANIYFKPGAGFIEKIVRQAANRPRAVIFINDLFALAALHACQKVGLKVPHDIAIGAFDGSAVGQYTTPSLTSVEIPVPEIAQQSVKLLTKIIQKKSAGEQKTPPILLPPKLLIRESCGGHPNKRGLANMLLASGKTFE